MKTEDRRALVGGAIRARRKEWGYTQSKLGELIGYSEKAVSKWESGAALPPLEVLIHLSELLSVDLESLLGLRNGGAFFLGIDGGATHTVFALADEHGRLIRRLEKGACNPIDNGMDAALGVLESGIREILTGFSYGDVSLFAGIAGGTTGGNDRVLRQFFSRFGFSSAACGSDRENAVAVGLEGRDGICAIIGTGSVITAVKNGVSRRIGGYGYLFDDDLSGYDLGRAVIAAALAAYDGSGEKTVLAGRVIEKIGGDPVEKLGEVYRRGKAYIASFAPLVFEAAMERDAVADRILDNACIKMAQKIASALSDYSGNEPVPVVFTGGLASQEAILRERLAAALSATRPTELHFTTREPVYGALRLAGLSVQEMKGETETS